MILPCTFRRHPCVHSSVCVHRSQCILMYTHTTVDLCVTHSCVYRHIMHRHSSLSSVTLLSTRVHARTPYSVPGVQLFTCVCTAVHTHTTLTGIRTGTAVADIDSGYTCRSSNLSIRARHGPSAHRVGETGWWGKA